MGLTNAVSDTDLDVTRVYLLTSRLNHSCEPNALVVCVGGDRCVFAAEDIDEGTEICISYIEDYSIGDAHAGLRDRIANVGGVLDINAELLLVGLFRQQIFAKWGFWCVCRRCAPLMEKADVAVARFLSASFIDEHGDVCQITDA